MTSFQADNGIVQEKRLLLKIPGQRIILLGNDATEESK